VTDIAFHFNAPDRIGYACRLLRKATASGAKVVVTGALETLQQIDLALWDFSPVDFVPHCFFNAEANVVSASPVILASTVCDAPHRQVLVNLGRDVPVGFELFERVIEVVCLDEDDRMTARGRWKHYADAGHTIIRHDLAQKTLQS
jgi:DNA polymerase III subunit chi